MIRTLLISVSALALTTAPALADTIAAVGKIWTGTEQGMIEDGVVVITDGVVTAVGGPSTDIPTDATILGGEGFWVTPGIISPFSRTGLVEVGAEKTTNDRAGSNENFSVALRASDGFNPAATPIATTRIEGVTRIVVAPSAGGSLFAGQGFIANTSGEADSITQPSAFVYAEIGLGGKSRAGGTRQASWAFLRQALSEAGLAGSGLYRATHRSTLSDADARALARVVRGETKLVLAAHRASDLLKIIELNEDRPALDLVIVGADEGWMVADELAAANIPVVIDPFQNLPASFEQLGATSRNAERLITAGVKTAFSHLGDDGHQARLVLQSAGNAVANGVAHEDALAAITNVPAEIFGIDSDYGDLSPGAIGDLVVWDGDPLEVTVSPVAVVIDGETQSLESRQTKLRDRYLSLEPNDKPFSYRKP